MELSRFVGETPKRSIEEIKASIEAVKRNILALEMEPSKFAFITPQSMPDLNVTINASSVNVNFLVGKERMQELVSVIGSSRVLETVEYSLIETYNMCKKRKRFAEQATFAVIDKIRKKNLDMPKKRKVPDIHVLRMDKKTEMVKGQVYQLMDSEKEQAIHGRHIVFNVKNKNNSKEFVFLSLQFQDETGAWIDRDTITGELDAEKKTTVSIKVPSTFRVLAKATSEGISIKLKKVDAFPIQQS